VVLSIDSPGGLVSGCFDTADEIRAACDDRKATLVAYVDGQATSAAYALACVASRVYVPPTGIVGSIGVIDALVDATVQDRAMGLGFTIVASGARKADGNPHAPVTDAAVAAAQSRVDDLAGLFFAHVAARRGVSTEQLSSLQAGLVHGSQAVAAGLADAVATLDQVLALVRSGADVAAASAQTPTTTEVTNMDEEQEKAYRASLQAVVDDEKSDEKARSRAKAILAAMDGEPDGDEPQKEGKAEGDEPHKEPDGDEAAKAVSASATARAADTDRLDRIERRQLLSTRPDLSEAQRTALASVPVSALEAALLAIPRAAVKPAATATVAATRGEGQGPSRGVPAPTPHDELDRAFGGARAESPVRKDRDNPTRTYFGVLTREQAKAITDKHTTGGAS
jgi:ClpP class serine protease